jgi:N-acetylmuramoyl-L-alanine amidase
VETGFIDSADTNLLTCHGDDIARAIARGVTDYGQDI